MNQVNYYRVLKQVRCNECEYEGNDVQFENYEIKQISLNTSSYMINMICPRCESVNKSTILED